MNPLRIVAVGLMTAAVLLAGTAHAQTTSTFNVNVSLTPMCYVNMTPAPGNGATTDVALPYTAFQVADVERSTSFTVTCTNNLGYGIDVTSDSATVLGINYFLRLVAGAVPSYTSAAGNASLASLTGSGAAQTYSIGVRAPGGQAGTCATPPCNDSNLHTITVTY